MCTKPVVLRANSPLSRRSIIVFPSEIGSADERTPRFVTLVLSRRLFDVYKCYWSITYARGSRINVHNGIERSGNCAAGIGWRGKNVKAESTQTTRPIHNVSRMYNLGQFVSPRCHIANRCAWRYRRNRANCTFKKKIEVFFCTFYRDYFLAILHSYKLRYFSSFFFLFQHLQFNTKILIKRSHCFLFYFLRRFYAFFSFDQSALCPKQNFHVNILIRDSCKWIY